MHLVTVYEYNLRRQLCLDPGGTIGSTPHTLCGTACAKIFARKCRLLYFLHLGWSGIEELQLVRFR
jgi:hypothetical protein